jgi:hypothetical protein
MNAIKGSCTLLGKNIKEVCENVLKLGLLGEFRTLRLWHWNMARYHRNCAKAYTPKSASACVHNAQADFHIKQVQLLNVFFEVGDTAEGDAAK